MGGPVGLSGGYDTTVSDGRRQSLESIWRGCGEIVTRRDAPGSGLLFVDDFPFARGDCPQVGMNETDSRFPLAHIRPWSDPIVDVRGHDPRSAYVERYWLGVIGPTATWIMRRLADRFDLEPDGFSIDLAHTATSMGLSFRDGATSPFGRALHRCVMFGLAQQRSDGYSVRRRLPTVAQRHLKRLPDDVRAAHDEWARRTHSIDRCGLERCLTDAGVAPATAAIAVEAAARAA